MVKVKYNARIIADKDFIEWLIKNDKSLFFKLTHIKASSSTHKKEHNIMFEDEIKKVLNLGIIQETTLRGAFKGIQKPLVIQQISSEIDQIIIYSINLSTEFPFKTFIFTNKDKIQNYTDSPHYKNIKNISVKTEKDAIAVINSLWRDFITVRELSRQ